MMDLKKAVANAKHSMELEGFVFEEEELKVLDKIAKGELPISILYEISDKRIAQLRKERPEIFVSDEEQ